MCLSTRLCLWVCLWRVLASVSLLTNYGPTDIKIPTAAFLAVDINVGFVNLALTFILRCLFLMKCANIPKICLQNTICLQNSICRTRFACRTIFICRILFTCRTQYAKHTDSETVTDAFCQSEVWMFLCRKSDETCELSGTYCTWCKKVYPKLNVYYTKTRHQPKHLFCRGHSIHNSSL